jgi:hypothetical protein
MDSLMNLVLSFENNPRMNYYYYYLSVLRNRIQIRDPVPFWLWDPE